MANDKCGLFRLSFIEMVGQILNLHYYSILFLKISAPVNKHRNMSANLYASGFYYLRLNRDSSAIIYWCLNMSLLG